MKHQRLIASFVCVVIALSTVCRTAPVRGQSPSEPSVEATRLARLSGLARLWGAVKYFHPYLAYKDIDWDKALIYTIPKVNAARTREEYRAAISQMLAVLNDSATRVEPENEKQASESNKPAATNTVKPVRRQGPVLVIDALQIAKTLAQDVTAVRGFMDDINDGLKTAAAIVIDARATQEPEGFVPYRFDRFLRQTLATLLYSPVVLGSTRYRMHSGYATQTDAGSDFYYSAFVSPAPQTIAGRKKTKTLPMAFIINRYSPDFGEVLSGMQSAVGALVICEGDAKPDSATLSIDLPDNLKVSMRTAELVNPNGTIGLQVDTIVPQGTTGDAVLKEALRLVQQDRVGPTRNRTTQPAASQVSQKDNPYAEMKFPSREYRLLALFRFWNVINYFYPYRKLIDESWQTVLPRFIPKFEADKDAGDYQLTVLELVTEIHDSHGGVRNADAMLERLGAFVPAVFTTYIENQSVVTRVLDDKLPIKVGDVVLSIDGEPVEKRREFLAHYAPASTPQWRMLWVHGTLLAGPKDSVMKLRVQGPDGVARDLELPRPFSILNPKLYEAERSSPMVQVLPSGYGYVDLARLQVADVDKMFETIKDTRAVIFDMRGYPNGTAWSIAPRLTEKKHVVAALFSRPLLEAINIEDLDNADPPSYSFSQELPEAKGPAYKGKVVVLINEEAISQAEHTCLFFEAATDVTFIGTPTAGANGDVTLMVLPGNLAVSFTGHNVRHADGRQLQRVGIQPTIRVEPTIRGTAAGRDEVLEAAVKYLQEKLKQ